MLNGEGVFESADGELFYEGTWRNGELTGKVDLMSRKANYYKGDFMNWKK